MSATTKDMDHNCIGNGCRFAGCENQALKYPNPGPDEVCALCSNRAGEHSAMHLRCPIGKSPAGWGVYSADKFAPAVGEPLRSP